MTRTSPFQSAWYRRYADMPTIPGRSQLPRMDGDIAWLHHLRDEITYEISHSNIGLKPLPVDAIYHQTIDHTWIHPEQLLRHWPGDRAAMLLARWRYER